MKPPDYPTGITDSTYDGEVGPRATPAGPPARRASRECDGDDNDDDHGAFTASVAPHE